MVPDAKPLEILLDQPLLSEDEDKVSGHTYDTAYFMNRHKELVQMERVLIGNTIVLSAPLLYSILYGVKLPIPFSIPFCYTHGVFGYPLWSLAIVLFIVVVALGYIVLDWWKKTRPVDD